MAEVTKSKISSKKGSFAEQLSARTAPYFEEVVKVSVESAKAMLEAYFDEVAVDRNADLNKVNTELTKSFENYKDINSRLSFLIQSESSWNTDIVKRLTSLKEEIKPKEEVKSTPKKTEIVDRKESKEKPVEDLRVVERSVISTQGEENRPVEAGKLSVLQVVSDIKERLMKASEVNEKDVKQVTDSFVKPLEEYNKANVKAHQNVRKSLESIKKKLPTNLVQKVLKGVGLLFIGLAFRERIKEALDSFSTIVKDAILTFVPGAKEAKERVENLDKWGTLQKVDPNVEKEVLETPRESLPEVIESHEQDRPKLFESESIGEWWKDWSDWRFKKKMLNKVDEDWYKYHPEDLPEQQLLDEETVKADLWALTPYSRFQPFGIKLPNISPFAAASADPFANEQVELQSSRGFFYKEFAKTPEAEAIRSEHSTDVGIGAYGPYSGLMYNTSFQKDFKKAFEEWAAPFLEKAGGNWSQAVEIYTETVNYNKSPIPNH